MSERWTVDELLALLGTSNKHLEITEDDLGRVVEIFNGEADDAHTLDEIALASFQGLLASGKFHETPGAAGTVAWVDCVPGFLRGKSMFLHMEKTLMALTVYAPPAADV